jgi:hypothetical protein
MLLLFFWEFLESVVESVYNDLEGNGGVGVRCG